MKEMKNAIFAIALMLVSTISLGQRKIPMATRYCPKMQNQITKEDSLSDDFGKEYTEREFRGVEEDTAALNAQFRRIEALQEKNMTPVEKPDGPNMEEMYWLNMDDMRKIHEEEKKNKSSKSEKRPK